ncbi:Rrf2 family transcriptional regulator [Paracoccus zhejiangensis]|uniref:Rrf2 family transcriptional regulator n=1 Tax=Paracoccus zhejiangensis TaxID=1077935 RepID=A0A2H5EYE7_9RHOB|nr:Rrf2 family transcriptional regulator [Paracoccus zhejiangensis]AUH64293.1 Rrf2 family transcriptional regulator [Paracoccus zhejiangensis]
MLSQKARYAFHAMTYLARKGEPASVAEIAASEGMPAKFLEQVMAALKAGGLVASRRGAGGGYRLARPAVEISFAAIMRCIDGPLALAPCASQHAYGPCADCKTPEACEIRQVLISVRDTTALLLEGTSLAEMIGGRKISFI